MVAVFQKRAFIRKGLGELKLQFPCLLWRRMKNYAFCLAFQALCSVMASFVAFLLLLLLLFSAGQASLPITACSVVCRILLAGFSKACFSITQQQGD